MSDRTSRRRFLERIAGLGAAAVGLGGLVGCVPDREDVEDLPAVEASTCEGYGPPPEGTYELRRELDYTDYSEYPNNVCANCANFTADTTPEGCGTCSLIGGPVAPAGWCSSYVPVEA